MTLDDIRIMVEEFKAAGKGELKGVNFPIILPLEVIRELIDNHEPDRRLFVNTNFKRNFSGFGYIHNETTHEFLTFTPELAKDLAKIETMKDENKALKQAAINKFLEENKHGSI